MKKGFEHKFKEFTRALQTTLSDEKIKKSVHSMAQSVLTPKKGDIKPVEEGLCLRYTICNGV
jgi:putative component of toxin-antitoxin plasmid stabilization module